MAQRLFVALFFPEMGDYFTLIQSRIQEEHLFEGRYIPPGQIHMTFAFLGDVDEADVPLVQEALRRVQHEAFYLCLQGLGLLPTSAEPKILYGVLESISAQILAHDIQNVLAAWIKKDDRPFLPHCTLARITSIKNHDDLITYIERFPFEPICFEVTEFVLMRSQLTQEGSVYSVIKKYPLVND